MRKNLKFFTTVLTILFTILLLADVGNAQRRATGRIGYSKQYIEQLLERIEERNDAFTKSFDQALDDSRLDRTRTEENFTDRSRDLENATDELRREFDHNDTRGETAANIRNVMNIATDINRIMISGNFGRKAEITWMALRTELNTLAKIYGLPVVGSRTYRLSPARNTRSALPPVRSATNSKQYVEQLLERIEERTDAFSNQLNKSLDRSRLDGSRTEDGIAQRYRDLENETDELRREFDHGDARGETKANARAVLNTATVVDRLMRSRNFGGLTESTWTTLRAELNALAKIYGLPVVGSRTYR
jgi:hypothetical protein